jgi:RNase P subunit RPR2
MSRDGLFAAKRNVCRGCGRPLDSRVARVLGDNDGCVEQCRRCGEGRGGNELHSTTRLVVREEDR